MKQAVNDPRVKEQYRKIGFEVVGEGSEETAKRVKEETEMWRKTVETAGIKISQ
jgi:tripartite-type tricarboxylate transporter receptor subunit TctC